MPIKFACPSCKKSISAREHLAGKSVKCPSCKQPLTVPAPVAAPADVEELALSVLAEKGAEQPAVESKPIEFACPQCDEPVTVPGELGGKQTPCPHCKRIIKVPLPVRVEPKDWRKAQTAGPSAARQNVEAAAEAPEGAWGSTAARAVSHDALVEAGAVPEEKERLTLQQKIARAAIAAAVLLVAGLVGWKVYSTITGNREARSLAQVLAAAKELRDKRPEAAAALDTGVGEYYLGTNQPGCLKPALTQFQEARDRLANASGSEREPLLIELARAQIGLGGLPDAVENETRMGWVPSKGTKFAGPRPGADQEIRQTLDKLRSPDARLAAVRELTRVLTAKGQAKLAAALAAELAPSEDQRAEAQALAGLEMWQTDPTAAENEANLALGSVVPPDKKGAKPTLSPSLIALCLVLEKRELFARLPAEAQAGVKSGDPAVLLGYVEGLALKGDAPQARAITAQIKGAEDRVKAAAAIAAALAPKEPEEARQELEGTVPIIARGGRSMSPWLVLRVIRLGGEVGMPEPTLQALPAGIADPGLRGWAQLEVLRARLAASKEKAADDWAAGIEKQTTAEAVAREAIARHNARREGGALAEAQKTPEPYRPFAVLGALLGGQGGK
jgi:Zn finger protein HypA/HybF involved in hydrogenase expression